MATMKAARIDAFDGPAARSRDEAPVPQLG